MPSQHSLSFLTNMGPKSCSHHFSCLQCQPLCLPLLFCLLSTHLPRQLHIATSGGTVCKPLLQAFQVPSSLVLECKQLYKKTSVTFWINGDRGRQVLISHCASLRTALNLCFTHRTCTARKECENHCFQFRNYYIQNPAFSGNSIVCPSDTV